MRVLDEGTRLADRYVLIRRLGGGGMAEIWLARDQRADSLVALKFLHGERAGDPSCREQFHREWRIASRLMHAHIVRVFEYHDDPERPFYALQFLSGPDFGVLANEPLDNAMRPFGLLADALRYAHGKQVVHCDIKAANVLLDARGAPYLVDFGVAATADSASAGGGSAIALSPARLAGQAPRPEDDIYALGVLMHEIICGAPPSPDPADRPMHRPSGEPVPESLQQLVTQMLAVDPGARPAAEDVRQSLAASGFDAGPARLKTGAAGAGVEAVPVTVESIRPVPRAAREPDSSPDGRAAAAGLSPRLVYGGLGALLVLFVGVIFVLPGIVGQPDEDPGIGMPSQGGNGDAGTAADDTAGTVGIEASPGIDGSRAGFDENLGETSADEVMRIKLATDEALGDLLSQLERLKYRGIERWGGQPYLDALDTYARGDEAYLNKNYRAAGERYREATLMLEPFFDRIEPEFRKSLAAARAAFDAGDFIDAVRLYDLAVAITPGNPEAEEGLARALNLEAVLNLMDQGLRFEDELELQAAQLAYEKALALDSAWQPARDAIARVRAAIGQLSFESRMTEGLDALAAGDYATARAAFDAAKVINPQSREPGDGLLQVDQEIRLANIRTMEREAQEQEANEQWEGAVSTYQALLDVDADLQFAKEGLQRAGARAALHRQLQDYIDEPDALSEPTTMQKATGLLLSVSRMNPVGPRLEDQKNELSRLLKRAATPLTVRLMSDNATEVSVYRVGKLGSFATQDLDLRPGTYVAIGVRPGYRDVRLEFRVAPEIELKPVVVQCEEAI